MPKTINPLRYPGAKRQLVQYIHNLLISNNIQGCKFYEPYAGSAVVGLELLKKNVISELVLVEKDILVYSFWKCVFNHSEDLCSRIEESKINIETWHTLEPLRKASSPNDATILDLGFAGLFFNRTNFSGIINANPIGGLSQTSEYSINCRFNKQVLINLIKELSILDTKVQVYWDDALSFMNKNTKNIYRDFSFVYFDPPYFEKGKQIYRHYYTDTEHKALANFVKDAKHFDWLISYDDAPFICGLYGGSGAKYRPIYLDYCVAKETRSRGKELLISNLPLPPYPLPKTSSNT